MIYRRHDVQTKDYFVLWCLLLIFYSDDPENPLGLDNVTYLDVHSQGVELGHCWMNNPGRNRSI